MRSDRATLCASTRVLNRFSHPLRLTSNVTLPDIRAGTPPPQSQVDVRGNHRLAPR